MTEQPNQRGLPMSQPPRSPEGYTLEELAELANSADLAAAELELHQWQRQPDCPTAARVLLAGLLSRRNQLEHARTVLEPTVSRPVNELSPEEARLLLALLVGLKLEDQAEHLAGRLQASSVADAGLDGWLQLMELTPGEEPLGPDAATVEHLAGELAGNPEVIPSLVAAEQYEPDRRRRTLLRRALTLVAPTASETGHLLMVCRAQAELAQIAGDEDEARRWAHRGLRLEPRDETLALVLARINDDLTVGPPARQVLAEAVRGHPTYPDLRRELIRRHQRDGHRHSARALLARWLNREPNSPIARSLDKELAA